ncbi:MAG: hypothetical protein IPK63_15635 [Candidatus Competibacteraceae bacterium]|nr:hypothetical protein [Candidatus Competibacteraceae bacterium]
MTYFISCDPGAEGAIAIFRQSVVTGDLILVETHRTDCPASFIAHVHKLGRIARVAIEKNHGIQGQPAGTSYTQGYNAGFSAATLVVLSGRVLEEVSAAKWMRAFGVPSGLPKAERKRWIRDKASEAVGKKLTLWQSDAVAIGLATFSATAK